MPAAPRFETAEAASQYLITEHSICTVPWDDAGAFLRFSVTYEAPDEAAEDALMAETEAAAQAAGAAVFVRRHLGVQASACNRAA